MELFKNRLTVIQLDFHNIMSATRSFFLVFLFWYSVDAPLYADDHKVLPVVKGKFTLTRISTNHWTADYRLVEYEGEEKLALFHRNGKTFQNFSINVTAYDGDPVKGYYAFSPFTGGSND